MYFLTVKSSISGAHQLKDFPGDCKRIHGHNWQIKATIKSSELNHNGMVMDLFELQNILDKCLEKFDHQFLNHIEPFDKIAPTSENIAFLVFTEMAEKLPEFITMESIEVCETPDFKVLYKP